MGSLFWTAKRDGLNWLERYSLIDWGCVLWRTLEISSSEKRLIYYLKGGTLNSSPVCVRINQHRIHSLVAPSSVKLEIYCVVILTENSRNILLQAPTAKLVLIQQLWHISFDHLWALKPVNLSVFSSKIRSFRVVLLLLFWTRWHQHFWSPMHH